MAEQDIYQLEITKISFEYELADLTATLTGGVITGVTINDGGVGQIGASIVVTGDGASAVLDPVLDDEGAITSVTITNGGTGYTTTTLTVTATEPSANVELYSTVDEGITWVLEDTYAITTTEQDFITIIDKEDVDGLRLTYAGGLTTRLKVLSMIPYNKIDVNTDVIMAPFVFNLDQKYIIVMRNELITVYENEVLIDTVTATGLLSTYFETLKTTQAEDTMILTHPDMETKQLQRTFRSQAYTNDPAAGSSISLTMIDTSGFSDGDVVKVSSSAGSELATITAVVTDTSITVDTLTLNHTTVTPLVTSQVTTEWTFSAFAFINVPNDAFNNEVTTQPAQTLTPSATEGSVKLTAGGAVFTAASVGQLVDGNGGRVRITQYESATIVYGFTIIPFYTTAAIASGLWDYISGYEPVWSATRGYPTTCLFYEQRLWFGGSKSKPNTLWASRVGQYTDFENIANYANDSISATISSEQIDEIVNIYANRGIQIFTGGAEWIIPEGATTPDTINVTKNTSNGSTGRVTPIDISGVTMFVEKNGKSLLSFVYSDAQAAYTTESISLLTDLMQNPVSLAVDYNSSQDVGNFLYVVMEDGTMAVWCIMLGQKIVSPVRFEIAGSGLIKSVINVAGDTYLLVVRGEYAYLEKLSDVLTDFTTTDTSLAANITGLDDYNFTTVHAYTDTVDYGDFAVVLGEITLPTVPTEDVYIGYDFDYALTSNKISINGQTENIEKRIAKATVVTRNTPQLTFENQTMAQTDDVYDIYGVTGFRRDCRFHITGTWNYTEILSIILNINYGEK